MYTLTLKDRCAYNMKTLLPRKITPASPSPDSSGFTLKTDFKFHRDHEEKAKSWNNQAALIVFPDQTTPSTENQTHSCVLWHILQHRFKEFPTAQQFKGSLSRDTSLQADG